MQTRDIRYVGSLPVVRNEAGEFARGEVYAVPAALAERLCQQRAWEYAEGAEDAPTSLDDVNVEDLRKIAAELNVEGRSGMNKGELIEAIEDARNQEA